MSSIETLGARYNAIQIDMGSAAHPENHNDWSDEIQGLFSKDFTKTANGHVLVKERSELNTQIAQCRKDFGRWQIEEKEILPSKDNQSCAVRYVIATEDAGSFHVIAILKSKDALKIDSIDEVYYKID